VDHLLDTNILLRTVDAGAPQHVMAKMAITGLVLQGHRPLITAQTLIEFWAVVTRPVEANGLGWSCERARQEIDEIQKRFPLLPDSPPVLGEWIELVLTARVIGKRTHDARLVAVMLAHGVKHLLTFNAADFKSFVTIVVVSPEPIAAKFLTPPG
jgi:predicted nucleic acid-binding protein